MPASVVLALEGPASARPSGHGELACFLDLVRRVDPALSAALHANERLKPFTVSPLTLDRETPAHDGRARFWLRMTALDERLADIVARPATDRVRIGRVTLDVTAVVTQPWRHAWAGAASYERLVNAVQAAATDSAVVLEFHTPTAFSSNVRNVVRLFPEPALVFRSLGKRWNTHAGERFAIDDELLQELCDGIRVERYALETREAPLGPRTRSKGFIGTCEYSAGRRGATDCRRFLRLLAEFAFFAGVGLRTTMGMGQVSLASRGSDTELLASLTG